MYGKNAKCHYGSWLNPLLKNAPGWRALPHPESFLLCRDRSLGTAGSSEECGMQESSLLARSTQIFVATAS